MINSKSFASTLQLYSEPNSRRLFKARRQEMESVEIRTQTAVALATTTGMQRNCTVYSFQIRPKSAIDMNGEWTLNKRYSEVAAFRSTLLRLVRHWEERLEGLDKAHSREFEIVSNVVRRPIAPNFPRKHVRGDNSEIVTERRHGLRYFVRKLLDTYVDLSVYLYNNPPSDDATLEELREIYDKIEKFLEVPPVQKELERRQLAAVLALEDVADENISPDHCYADDEHPERTCCICLDDYECEADEQDAFNAILLADIEPETLGRDKMVKLPCGHHFHEDCVIEWFNTSITCPLCRKEVIADERLSFDVTMS
ncbi:hypothetical protein Poli38472_008095 [Pythium oligandrum]|uniref:RING-type domain-containing protein n=1 Tax=Pythium oligandrum TaxID=41045 RepID=A0A8K1CND8_PYTOL|nr:hypothetical protein Poli38472_008095 [Pythium oligandrum]|eukprot:TMW65453.1 hypothetical protein Poli38472_008095 [Pythium oligandrum]